MNLLPGSRVADRYTVIRPLGQGGIAAVWLVRHDALQTLHALKVLHAGSDALHSRMVHEGRIQAQLQHPNIAAVSDLLRLGSAVGLVIDYISGPSLRSLLAVHRPTLQEAQGLFRGIVTGVARAHAAGLVHRDLKPANVLLHLTDGNDIVPKVADFGLAKALGGSHLTDAHATRTGAMLGTPAYMAPEQIRDASSVDAMADVFSLGAIAYELVTGLRAFEGEDVADTLMRVKEVRYTPVTSLVPDVPDGLRACIEMSLVADPRRRPPAADALLALLGREGEGPWPQALVARVSSLSSAHPDDGVGGQQTWSGSDSGPSSTTWHADSVVAAPPANAIAAQRPGWIHAAGGLALFVAGMALMGTTSWWLSRPAEPPVAVVEPFVAAPVPVRIEVPVPLPVPVPVPLPVPVEVRVEVPVPTPPVGAPYEPPPMSQSQKAAMNLNFFLTDLSTEAVKGQKDLIWLSETLPARVAEADALAADVERRFPNTDAALQARYLVAMVRFLSYSHRSWVQPPREASDADRLHWESVIEKQIRPGAIAALKDAKVHFDALSVTDHPAAEDSMWPHVAQQMSAQIETIPPLPPLSFAAPSP